MQLMNTHEVQIIRYTENYVNGKLVKTPLPVITAFANVQPCSGQEAGNLQNEAMVYDSTGNRLINHINVYCLRHQIMLNDVIKIVRALNGVTASAYFGKLYECIRLADYSGQGTNINHYKAICFLKEV